MRHPVGRHLQHLQSAVLRTQPHLSRLCPDSPPGQHQQTAVGQDGMQTADMGPHRPIAEAARPRGIAGCHPAEAGRGFRRIRREETGSSPAELLPGLLILRLPAGSLITTALQCLPEYRKDHAGLQAESVGISLSADPQDSVHAGQVHDMAARRYCPCRQTRTSALHRYRNLLRIQLFEDPADLLFRFRKGNRIRPAGRPGFIMPVFVIL